VYHCEPCSYDCHVECLVVDKENGKAKAKESGPVVGKKYNSPKHAHEITYQATVYNGAYQCNLCGGSKRGVVYQ
jgi:hypothetical protein